MKDRLIYKDFIGSVHFSAEDDVFFGKIEMISDLVTFEGRSPDELKKAFHEAVEGYMELCKQVDKAPQKAFKGTFNVRIEPDLHKRAAELATLRGITLNQLVRDSIESMVASRGRAVRVGRVLAKKSATKKPARSRVKSASERHLKKAK